MTDVEQQVAEARRELIGAQESLRRIRADYAEEPDLLAFYEPSARWLVESWERYIAERESEGNAAAPQKSSIPDRPAYAETGSSDEDRIVLSCKCGREVVLNPLNAHAYLSSGIPRCECGGRRDFCFVYASTPQNPTPPQPS